MGNGADAGAAATGSVSTPSRCKTDDTRSPNDWSDTRTLENAASSDMPSAIGAKGSAFCTDWHQ